jgi:hypothetical protein
MRKVISSEKGSLLRTVPRLRCLEQSRHILVWKPGRARQSSIYSASTSKVNLPLGFGYDHENGLCALATKTRPSLCRSMPGKKAAAPRFTPSAIDDGSGVTYQEYLCLYGEDAGGALRFLCISGHPPFHSLFLRSRRPSALRHTGPLGSTPFE